MLYFNLIVALVFSYVCYIFLKDGVLEKELSFPNDEIISLKDRPFSYTFLMLFFFLWEIAFLVAAVSFIIEIISQYLDLG
ncbi:hypothetical protein RED65_00420 [Oceanobacter sp. RED65]|uniref:Uncharacterized protein n=1 Tax=Bermanella marisrubri TaxID=207949 RepID=Q1N5A0_9GAMM|nr:hypothetical protein RED65_00420 [Oceanobacter sp. RED65] [Bermanella marisrubri]